ncbi:DNA-processing protein DprA [Aureimonas fodinaquatilis]|uniref:DNA-processing protein DprA n=1 Tax=Aureimonas fodinaquatilis TaxID=2565783 RepID=UPI001FE29139|nr:DNA-processing protein DprA [Aureimonas fodinaquatilis]
MQACGQFSETERYARLRLARSVKVGPATFCALTSRFGSARNALVALPHCREAKYRSIVLASEADIEQEFLKAERFGAKLHFQGESSFPALLGTIAPPPPVLTIMGESNLLNRPSLAIVGARNASLAGMKLTQRLAKHAGEAGLCIISGLARGIDTAAHEASLTTGTAGVFAGGLDRPYPPENKPLMRAILDHGGCLISEMPFGWEPRPADFPRRNRLVAGLANGLLVVEAAERSGSLISARLAREMQRPVMAVPGSPLDSRSAGTNALLQQGAILVAGPDDILKALNQCGIFSGSDSKSISEICPVDGDEPDDSAKIIAALSTVPVSLDELVAHTGFSGPMVQLVLMELNLAGKLQRHADGRVSLCG